MITMSQYIKIVFILLSLFPISFAQIDSTQSSNPEPDWQINKDLIVNKNGRPQNELIAYIIKNLKAHNGGGVRVTKNEFLNYFKRPESRIVYSNRLIKYATPLSEEIQKKEHENFAKIFLNERKLNQGVEFIKEHFKFLSLAEKQYGIQIKDLVSILMWESGLGVYTGKYQIFNIYLGQILFLDEAQNYAVEELKREGKENPLDDPAYAKKEKRRLDYRKRDAANSLVSLLRYCKQNHIDPLKQKGSWGGAIGYVQFMPYNFKYVVDANKDGEKDLFSWPDAILSAANFLESRGKYKSDIESRRSALLKYNASPEYVDGVILYAEELWKRYLSPQ